MYESDEKGVFLFDLLAICIRKEREIRRENR